MNDAVVDDTRHSDEGPSDMDSRLTQPGIWKPVLVLPGTFLVIVVFLWLANGVIDEFARTQRIRTMPRQSSQGLIPFLSRRQSPESFRNFRVTVSLFFCGIPTMLAVGMAALLAHVTGKQFFYNTLAAGCAALCVLQLFIIAMGV